MVLIIVDVYVTPSLLHPPDPTVKSTPTSSGITFGHGGMKFGVRLQRERSARDG